MKRKAILVLTQALSWPVLFPLFRLVQKVCLHAMNRTSAAFLAVQYTGERHVVQRALRSLTGPGVIVDCGANTGNYTDLVLAEAQRAGAVVTVHALEPSSHCSAMLSSRFHDSTTVRIHRLAAARASGTGQLFFPWPGAGGASLSADASAVQGNAAFAERTEDVTLVSLDDFCKAQGVTDIHLLKLDIEGYEFEALAGAGQLIRDGRLHMIQLEISSAALVTGGSLYRLWQSFGTVFDIYLVQVHGLLRITAYQPDLECFFAASTFFLVRRPLA